MALNSRDQAKWNSLQNAGDRAVDRVLAGAASDVDIRELSKVLAEQHELAGQVFDEAVENAKTTADTFLDQLNKKRIDEGKRPLTQKAHERLFQSSFKKIMAESLEDVLAMVHQEFEDHSQQVRDKVGDALDKLQATVKTKQKDEGQGPVRPAHADLFQRFAGYVGNRDGFDPRAPAKRSMMDRMLGRNRDPNAPRSTMLNSIKEAVSSTKDKLTNFYERFRTRGKGEDEEKSASIWIRKLKAVFNPVGNAYKKMKAGGSKIWEILKMIGKPLMLALMNPQLLKSITSAIGEYLSFDNISKLVSGMWDDTKKFASEAFDSAMDKVKSFFGYGKDKKKVAAEAIPARQSSAIASTTTAAQAKAALPGLTTQIASAKSRVDAAQKAYDANPTAVNKKALEDAKGQLQVLNVQYTQYASKAQAASTAAIEPATKAQSSVSSGSDAPGPQTAVAAPAVAAQVAAKSSAGPMMPQTEIVDNMPVYRSGRPVGYVPKEKAAAPTEGRKDAALSTIGLGSFGFDSNDSSLNILNMGMLA